MRSIISQSIVLPAPAESLFAMYTDPAKHAAITGAPVAISAEPGSPFEAFNGALTGAMLQIIPQRLVIQSWRSIKFNDGDPDSTLILAFTPEGTNGRIDLVHLDVPAHNHQGMVEGWETHYGGPSALSRRLTAQVSRRSCGPSWTEPVGIETSRTRADLRLSCQRRMFLLWWRGAGGCGSI
jgi:hypothetical protein